MLPLHGSDYRNHTCTRPVPARTPQTRSERTAPSSQMMADKRLFPTLGAAMFIIMILITLRTGMFLDYGGRCVCCSPASSNSMALLVNSEGAQQLFAQVRDLKPALCHFSLCQPMPLFLFRIRFFFRLFASPGPERVQGERGGREKRETQVEQYAWTAFIRRTLKRLLRYCSIPCRFKSR